MPAEFMLMPAKAPINIYRVSSWARSTTVPLLIIYHHRLIYALPNGQATQNDFLDELWYCSPPHSKIPYCPPVWDIWKNGLLILVFAPIDKVLSCFGHFQREAKHRESVWSGFYSIKRSLETGQAYSCPCTSVFWLLFLKISRSQTTLCGGA